MNISEGLFLLLITDKGGNEPWVIAHDQAINAGVVADLALGGQITLSEDKHPVIEIVDAAPAPNQPALQSALKLLAEKAPVRVDKALNATWFKTRNEIGSDLAKRDIVRVDTNSFLFFTSVKHPTVDGESEQLLRERLVRVLRGHEQPTAQDAVLLNILKSIDAVRPLLKKDIEAAGGRARKKDLDNRIDGLADHVEGLSEPLAKVFKSLVVMMYVVPSAVAVSATSAVN